MSLGGSNSSSRNYYKPALPYLQQFKGVGNTWLNNWDPGQQNGADNALFQDVNGAGYANPYVPAAANAITRQAGNNLAMQQHATDDASQASGMLTSNKSGQANALNTRLSADAVSQQLEQLASANYASGRQLQMQAAPQAYQQSQVPYQQALQIAQLFGGLGSGSSVSNPSMLGWLL